MEGIEQQDKIVRAYAMLSALKQNIDQMKDFNIEEKYVSEFHNVLDKLESIGIEVAEFRIHNSLVKPKVTSRRSSYGGGGHTSYSEEKYIEKSFILTKIDAVLGYFKIITSDKQKKMGFTTH